jgi:hypothetical protein
VTERHTEHERALLARLAEAFDRLDPVPSAVQAAAEAAGRQPRPAPSTRWLPLLRDTAIEPLALALRSGADGRVLGFGDPATALRVEVSDMDIGMGAGLRVTGLLSTERPCGKVSVCWPDGVAETPVDPLGRFEIDGLPAGPLCLRLWQADRLVAVTAWFVG